jgi:hypothetical protein
MAAPEGFGATLPPGPLGLSARVGALGSRRSGRGTRVEALRSRHSGRGTPVGALRSGHSGRGTPVGALGVRRKVPASGRGEGEVVPDRNLGCQRALAVCVERARPAQAASRRGGTCSYQRATERQWSGHAQWRARGQRCSTPLWSRVVSVHARRRRRADAARHFNPRVGNRDDPARSQRKDPASGTQARRTVAQRASLWRPPQGWSGSSRPELRWVEDHPGSGQPDGIWPSTTFHVKRRPASRRPRTSAGIGRVRTPRVALIRTVRK